MASDARFTRVSPFVIGVLLRALLLGALAYASAWLVLNTNYYATTLVVLICGGLVVADLGRVVTRADRSVERFLEALSAGALETPSRTAAGLGRLAGPFEDAVALLQTARRQRQQSNEYLQTLLDTVPAALLVIQADGEFALVNRAAVRLAGTAATATLLRVLGPAACAQLVSLAPGTHQILRLAGGAQVLASAAQFMLPGGAPQRLISLQRLAGELDAVELKAWDDMVRVLAHEMMNSLTPIASLSESLEGLLRGGHTEEVSGALEVISRRSQGLMRFVERYRKVAELPQATLQSVRLRDLLQGIEQLLRASYAAAGIEFHTSVVPPDLAARMDPDLIEQALINLLRNAADAVAGQPEPRIEIVCGEEEGQLRLDVLDNGRGLTESEREQIFVPFFTTKPGGSGVGLSLARRIALGHGGRLTVQAREPRGSAFTLLLPAARA
uniref:histidine kinase n=1 Tax=uncultured bacterium BLR8 TaxID=506524 RepID=C0IN95_9BACT|nr:two-component system sensor histidine kinase [uncultured bacterium BLR8]